MWKDPLKKSMLLQSGTKRQNCYMDGSQSRRKERSTCGQLDAFLLNFCQEEFCLQDEIVSGFRRSLNLKLCYKFPLLDLQQLKLIIELLGTPKAEFFEPSHHSIKTLYNQNLMEGEKFIKTLPFMRRRNFSRYFEDADSLAIDLIEQLLVLEPDQRITSEEALNHGFFKSFPRKNYDNLVKFDNSFEADNHSLDKWRGELMCHI